MTVTLTPWTIPLEFFGAFRFVGSVLAATWIFVRGAAPRRDGYGWRVAAVLTLAVFVGISYPFAFAASAAGTLTNLSMMDVARVWIFSVFLLALLAVKCCRVISWTNALFRWMLGLCVERFITAFVYNWLFLIIVPGFRDAHPVGYMAVCAFAYALFLGAAMLWLAPIFRRGVDVDDIVGFGTGVGGDAAGDAGVPYDAGTASHGENRMLIILYTASFLTLATISNISMHISEYWVPFLRDAYGNDAGFDAILWFSTSMAGVVAIVIFLFQYAIYHTATLRQESAMLNLLAEQKEQQYVTLRDNIEFINRKTHDLKHQVAALEFSDDARRGAMVREVQQALNLYDSTANTGSPALDTLITERNLYCACNGIRLSCMLRGCDWDAVDVVDLFTMLGNALDNACEYVSRFDDPNKRVVSLTARQHGRLIVISVDNYFEGFSGGVAGGTGGRATGVTAGRMTDDGLPATTKADKASHGLGLKSIRRIARQYGGDIQVTVAPPAFTLQISLMV